MASTKMKPGPIFIHAGGARGELISALLETLEVYDPKTTARLRQEYGPLFIFMAEAEHEHGSDWYEAAEKRWQRQADAVADQMVLAFGSMAPKGHYFGARASSGNMIEWGFWPDPERNPEEKVSDGLFHEGYRENPKMRRIGGGATSDAYIYRGRRIIVDKKKRNGDVLVQIVRKTTQRGYDVDAVVAEYYSSHPFPEQEARNIIEEWHEESKAKRRAKRTRIGVKLPSEIDPEVAIRQKEKQIATLQRLRQATEEAKAGIGIEAIARPRKIKVVAEGDARYAGTKAGAAMFKYGNATIEMRATGQEIETEEIRFFPDMVNVTVIGPDDTVLAVFSTWGGTRALGRAMNEVQKKARQNPKVATRGREDDKRRSFLRRMVRV